MKTNYQTFFAVWKQYCKKARISPDDSDDARRAFISVYYPEKNSLRECSAGEISYLIHRLNDAIEPQEMPKEAVQDGDRMRKKIIAILCETFNFRKEKNGKIVPDMVRINQFLKEKTAFKCELNALTIEQLPKVVTQMTKLQANEIQTKRKQMKAEG